MFLRGLMHDEAYDKLKSFMKLGDDEFKLKTSDIVDMNMIGLKGKSVLMEALDHGIDMIKYVASKCDVNMKCGSGTTALMYAYQKKPLKICETLMSSVKGIDASLADNHGKNLLFYAVDGKKCAKLTRLVRHTSIRQMSEYGNIFSYMIENSRSSDIAQLMKHVPDNFDINANDHLIGRFTPMISVIRSSSCTESLLKLVETPMAHKSTDNMFGNNSLMWAIAMNNMIAFNYILANLRSDDNQHPDQYTNRFGWTAIHYAAFHCNTYAMEKLMDNPSEAINQRIINQKTSEGFSPLMLVAHGSISKNEQLVKKSIYDMAILLVENGAQYEQEFEIVLIEREFGEVMTNLCKNPIFAFAMAKSRLTDMMSDSRFLKLHFIFPHIMLMHATCDAKRIADRISSKRSFIYNMDHKVNQAKIVGLCDYEVFDISHDQLKKMEPLSHMMRPLCKIITPVFVRNVLLTRNHVIIREILGGVDNKIFGDGNLSIKEMNNRLTTGNKAILEEILG